MPARLGLHFCDTARLAQISVQITGSWLSCVGTVRRPETMRKVARMFGIIGSEIFERIGGDAVGSQKDHIFEGSEQGRQGTGEPEVKQNSKELGRISSQPEAQQGRQQGQEITLPSSNEKTLWAVGLTGSPWKISR